MAILADIYLTLAPNHRDYYNEEVVTLCNNITAMGYDLTQCNYADNLMRRSIMVTISLRSAILGSGGILL